MRSLIARDAATMVLFALACAACGDRTSEKDVRTISRALADVMVSVQRGADSTARARIADSVSRAHGFDRWTELREAIGDVAVEPERLRTVLDSAQKRIEARSTQ